MTKDWRSAVVAPSATLADALQSLERSALGIVLVVDGERLAGVMTDGDIRRAIIAGHGVEVAVGGVAHGSPTTAPTTATRAELLGVMRARGIHHIPLLTEDGAVAGLATIDALLGGDDLPNLAVIMAGGLGTRLRPLTEEVPKPLLEVHGRTILETLIDRLAQQGLRSIAIAVNYRADQIRDHVGDGSRWGVEVAYIEEERPLGTAGALSLLPDAPEHPLVVLNGDIVTNADFTALLESRAAADAAITVGLHEHVTHVPYGVVDLDDGGDVLGVSEKPSVRHLVSAGIYAVAPETLALIPSGQPLPMTTLIDLALGAGRRVTGHRLDGYWMDVGRHEDLAAVRAQRPGE